MNNIYKTPLIMNYKPNMKTYYRPIFSSLPEKSSNKMAQVQTNLMDSPKGGNNKNLDLLQAQSNNDFFILSKENRIESPTSFYGCFYLGPFEAGHGITMGNTLRRTLLTSLFGYAITAVEIEGVAHEYSSIPGVKEPVLDILLAFNEIVLTSGNHSNNKKAFFAYLKKQGPGIVYASDLQLPPEVKCVNPQQVIATLSDTGSLVIKVQIQYGQHWTEIQGKNWYNPQQEDDSSIFIDSLLGSTGQNKNAEVIEQPWPQLQKQEGSKDMLSNNSIIGTRKSTTVLTSQDIAVQTNLHQIINYSTKRSSQKRLETLPLLLNPNFSPIRKINYLVDTYSSSKSIKEPLGATNLEVTGYENLYQVDTNFIELFKPKQQSEIVILEIWTNGSLHPRDALSQALYYCTSTFSKLTKRVF